MRICAVSDTHGQHRKINVPKCDVFVFAGDMSFFDSSLKQYVDFNDWLGTLPCLYKIVVAGNHDEFFEKKPLQARSVMTNCIYLQDEEDKAEDIVVQACMKLKTEVTLNYENSIWIMRTESGFGVGDTPEEAYVDLLDSINQEELYNKNLSNF